MTGGETRGMGPLETTVAGSLSNASGDALRDAAARELALTYARSIDLGDDLTKLGPALLAALVQLGLTPAARAALAKGVKDDVERPANPLDELRKRRAARTNRAPAVDSPTPAADA